VKRLLAVVLGAFGLRALVRRHRREAAPAEELREKLAAQRTAEPAAAAAPEPEPAPGPDAEPGPAAPQDDVETRRADVHARARQKIDELSS
jgi:hypothetical protein